jgi:CHRD domain
MRIKRSVAIGAVGLMAALVVPGIASAHGTHVKAKMSGDQVVGQAGAPNGTGTAKLHLLRQKSKVCFTVKYEQIGSRKGLDVGVYKGKRNQDGALQFTLVDEDLKSPIKDCVTGVSKKTLKKITRNPHSYNIDVKTDKYPQDGAIRGQLKAV